jgi:hypothetical protein
VIVRKSGQVSIQGRLIAAAGLCRGSVAVKSGWGQAVDLEEWPRKNRTWKSETVRR